MNYDGWQASRQSIFMDGQFWNGEEKSKFTQHPSSIDHHHHRFFAAMSIGAHFAAICHFCVSSSNPRTKIPCKHNNSISSSRLVAQQKLFDRRVVLFGLWVMVVARCRRRCRQWSATTRATPAPHSRSRRHATAQQSTTQTPQR